MIHLSIGRLLLQHRISDDSTDRLSTIVGHLNVGRKLVDSKEELSNLARLNLDAGNKAMGSLAYEQASKNYEIGIELLSDDHWTSQYNLSTSLYTKLAHCSFLLKKIEFADDTIDLLLSKTKSPEESAELLFLKARHYAVISRLEESIKISILGLSHLGIHVSPKPSMFSIVKEMIIAKFRLGKSSISTLIDSPKLSDPKKIIAQKLLMEIAAPAYLMGNEPLTTLIPLKLTNLSLRHGNSKESAFGFAFCGIIFGSVLNRPKMGYELGKLAVALNEKFQNSELSSRIYLIYGLLIHHWNEHIKTCIPFLETGYMAGYQSGDLLYMRYNALNCPTHDPTQDLATVCQEQKKYLLAVDDFECDEASDSNYLHLQLNMNFRGKNEGLFSMSNENWNETEALQNMISKDFKIGITGYHQYKAQIHFMYEDYEQCLEFSDKVRKNRQLITGQPIDISFSKYAFFSRTQLMSKMNLGQRLKAWRALRKEYKKVKKWSQNCPQNFLHIQLLMEAEIASIKKDYPKAAKLYNQSIADAKENGFKRDEALANELAAKHFADNFGQEASIGYLIEARNVYNCWGAAAKVEHIEKQYSSAFEGCYSAQKKKPILARDPITTSQSTEEWKDLDLHAILSASRAISSEISMGKLLSEVMQIIIKNAGANSGYLILESKSELFIRATAQADHIRVLNNESDDIIQPVSESELLPQSVIYYVFRTGHKVLLGNLSKDSSFSNDKYIFQNRPQSVLCLPIKRQKKTIGVLYLENDLTSDAFEEKRIVLLKAILSQAAISIENAHLYESLLKNEQRLDSILYHTPALVYIKDLNGKYIYVNRKFEKLFSVSATDFVGKIDNELFDEKTSIAMQHNDKKVLTQNEPFEFDENILIDGQLKSYMSVKFPLINSKEEVYAICGISTDITERKKMQMAIVKNEKMMSIGGLAAGMAHEIKNPLAAIIQSTAVVKNRLTQNHKSNIKVAEKYGFGMDDLGNYLKERKIEAMLEAIDESGLRAIQIIKNMLNFARNDSLEKSFCSISEIVDESIEFAKNDHSLNFHRIEITRDYCPDTPQLMCRKTELQQVFLNILKNGAEAMQDISDEKFQPKFNLRIYCENKTIKIVMQDNGLGIDSAIVNKILEPFYTTKSPGNGTGLGLSVSYFIITENHHGAISVVSPEGEGAKFSISLPITS